jgi:hypothetical protein
MRRNDVRVDATLDPRGADAVATLIEEHGDRIANAFDDTRTPRELVDAGNAYRKGELDPLGAAAVGLIVRTAMTKYGWEFAGIDRDKADWQLFSAWVVDGGPPFAVCALLHTDH